MVAEILRRAPYWTAMRCRLLFWEVLDGELLLDAVVSADQPDNADWDTSPGCPVTAVITPPSQRWLASARATLDRWVANGSEIELRRTRAWEGGSQVLLWDPHSSLLVTLSA